MISIAIKILGLLLALHPLFYISNNKSYKASKKFISLYLEIDRISIISTNSIFIIGSIFFFISIFFTNNILISIIFGLPLSAASYFCFIRDRFKSLSRGFGATGYFSFLYINTVYLSEIIKAFSTYIGFLSESIILFQILLIILYIEFGFIFASSGLFKLISSKNQPLSTALSLLNPNWSKFHKKIRIIQNYRFLLNWSGAIGQFLAGILIISFIPILQKIGFIIIALMFFSITPFYKLSWLCPSIAFTSLINYSLTDLVTVFNKEIIIFILLLRGLLFIKLFLEYFKNWDSNFWLEKYTLGLYRKVLGIIIWRVFTFDIVKVITHTSSFSSVENKKNSYKFRDFIGLAENINSYECITLVSLINSREYLEKNIWALKVNRYLEVKGRKNINWIECKKESAYKKYQHYNLGPFSDSKFFTQSYRKDLEINSFKNASNISEYIRK